MHALTSSLGVVHRSVRTEEFSISFSEPFRVVFLGTLLLLEGMVFTGAEAGEWWLLLVVVPTLTALFSAVSVAFLIWRYRFTVGPEGISCYDFWCQPITTSWAEMQTVSRIWLPGLTYARITTDERRRALWLPLFVDNPEGLYEIVALNVGEEHPLGKLLHREVA